MSQASVLPLAARGIIGRGILIGIARWYTFMYAAAMYAAAPLKIFK